MIIELKVSDINSYVEHDWFTSIDDFIIRSKNIDTDSIVEKLLIDGNYLVTIEYESYHLYINVTNYDYFKLPSDVLSYVIKYKRYYNIKTLIEE